ncbi:Transposable element Tc1 transposase, partial [Stegodyphus mimosarum]
MINDRTPLHEVATGTMTGQRYIYDVLLPHVRMSRGAVGDKFVSMDDNATYHRTIVVQECLESENIQCLVWPACSPELNPIKDVWDPLERSLAGRQWPPINKDTLIRPLIEAWNKLPQQLLDNVAVEQHLQSVQLQLPVPSLEILQPEALQQGLFMQQQSLLPVLSQQESPALAASQHWHCLHWHPAPHFVSIINLRETEKKISVIVLLEFGLKL